MMHTRREVDLWSHSLLSLQTAVSVTLALHSLSQSQRSLLLQVVVATCLGCLATLVPRTTGYPSSWTEFFCFLGRWGSHQSVHGATVCILSLEWFGSVPHKLRPGPLTLDPVQYCGAVNPAVVVINWLILQDFFRMVHQPTQHVCCNKFQPWN